MLQKEAEAAAKEEAKSAKKASAQEKVGKGKKAKSAVKANDDEAEDVEMADAQDGSDNEEVSGKSLKRKSTDDQASRWLLNSNFFTNDLSDS